MSLSEETRKNVVELLNNDNIQGAIEIFIENDTDIDTIFKEVATSVMEEVQAVVK